MPFTRRTGTRFKKSIALFLLVIIINQLAAPSVAYALTSGPTSPEATSFEPIDTTDMVNPLTGDFTYNMPLLEVPGPEGGYPLSLSYHAGIQPNEEASWVGLGWSLNPGAINRNVNGYADDWDHVANVSRSYWDGGQTETIKVSVGIGMGPASVNFGLAFSQDTYRGFGVGASIGVGFSYGFGKSPFGLSGGLSIGISAYGESYAGASIDIGVSKKVDGNLFASANLGVSTNFESVGVGASGGISYDDRKKGPDGKVSGSRVSVMELSMSSSNSKPSLTVGGGSVSVHNANEGRIQTESSGWSFGIPIGPVSVGIGYNYVRYWSDEKATVATNGVLYKRNLLTSVGTMDNEAEDNYYLLDPLNGNVADMPDPERLTGGTFPSYDDYSVSAQGLSGSMRPYMFQEVLYSQNKKFVQNADSKNIYQNIKATNATATTKKQFRFVNDFSNAYTQSSLNFNTESFQFNTPVYGKNDGVGYNASENRLEGSKHIEYFTNAQIMDNTTAGAKAKGFIDCAAAGFVRDNSGVLGKQIGGFMITNASGVTYHYALPAYSYGETVFTRPRNDDTRWNRLSKAEKYAYTWYLTAITGPDYVDRNADGKVNTGDWGYWVAFDYGKWVEDYGWRNPSEEYSRDIDNEFESYSQGAKQVFYLDAIRTRTHTAIFVKELRADGKSYNGNTYRPSQGQFCPETIVDSSDPRGNTYNYGIYYTTPKASLRLNTILLYTNEQLTTDLNTIRQGSNNYSSSIVFQHQMSTGQDCTELQKPHMGENVIDKFDVSTAMFAKCLRRINFNYDYSMSQGVPNSYDPEGTSTYVSNPSIAPLLGKLTLTSVDIRGKAGAEVQPLTEFEYDLDPTASENKTNIQIASVNGSNGVIVRNTSSNLIKPGDILTFKQSNKQYYCTLLAPGSASNSFEVRFLNQSPTPGSQLYEAVKTKNPPYNKDAYDMWGCYKSDFSNGDNENLVRSVSEVSNQSTDVWSLRKIKSPLGSDICINYEGDTYNKSVLTTNNSVIMDAGGDVNMVTKQISFALNSLTEQQVIDNYQVGDQLQSIMMFKQSVQSSEKTFENFPTFKLSENGTSTIVGISGKTLTVRLNDYIINKLNDFSYVVNNDPLHPVNSSTKSRKVLTGNTDFQVNHHQGGGVRVKEISLTKLSGEINKTVYNYGIPGFPISESHSSGVTAYEPLKFQADNVGGYSEDAKKAYRSRLYQKINYLLAIAREVPAPGVMYEYVSMQTIKVTPDGVSVPLTGKTLYQYEVFKGNMIGIRDLNFTIDQVNGPVQPWPVASPYHDLKVAQSSRKNLLLQDMTSRIGNLKRVVNYDIQGNKLTESINHYLHDDINNIRFTEQVPTYQSRLNNGYNGVMYNNQGVVQERFANSRLLYRNGQWNQARYLITAEEQYVMNTREVYPSIQTGSTQIDYKNGTKIEQRILGFDYFSGSVLKTQTSDSYGNRFINEVTPAYQKYAGMGLKTSSPGNKHMLTQEASNYTFRVDTNNNPLSVIAANAQVWQSNFSLLDENGATTTAGQANNWRIRRNFVWMDQSPIADFTGYFAAGGASNRKWKRTTELTRYNVFSAALESYDMNNNYAATRMGYNLSKVLLTGAPAKYYEIAYSGAEDPLIANGNFSINLTKGGGTIVNDSSRTHTGKRSLQVPFGKNGFTYSISQAGRNSSTKSYHVSVWVRSTSILEQAKLFYQMGTGEVVIPAQAYTKRAGLWYLLEMTVPGSVYATSTENLIVGCRHTGTAGGLYFDDFRFQPTTASTTAYVYDNLTGELTHILNNDNLYTRFEYDGGGRLIRSYKEVIGKGEVPVSSIKYNYGKKRTLL